MSAEFYAELLGGPADGERLPLSLGVVDTPVLRLPHCRQCSIVDATRYRYERTHQVTPGTTHTIYRYAGTVAA